MKIKIEIEENGYFLFVSIYVVFFSKHRSDCYLLVLLLDEIRIMIKVHVDCYNHAELICCDEKNENIVFIHLCIIYCINVVYENNNLLYIFDNNMIVLFLRTLICVEVISGILSSLNYDVDTNMVSLIIFNNICAEGSKRRFVLEI